MHVGRPLHETAVLVQAQVVMCCGLVVRGLIMPMQCSIGGRLCALALKLLRAPKGYYLPGGGAVCWDGVLCC